MMEDKNIDKLFRDKLKDYEQQPPAWLLENVLVKVAGAKRKRRIVLWRIAGVAAVLLLAFVAGWQVNYMNQDNLQQPVVVIQDTNEENKGASKSVPENEIVSSKTQEAKTTEADTSIPDRAPQIATAETEWETPAKTESHKNTQLASRVNQQQKNSLSEQLAITEREDFENLHSLQTITRMIPSTRDWTNGLHEMKVAPSVNEPAGQTIDQQIMEQNQQQLLAQKGKQKNARWLVGAQVSPAYSVNRSSHSSQYASEMLNSSSNTPIEMGGGLSVEYKPGKRWSLQSGVYLAGLGQSSGNESNTNRNMDYAANNGAEYFNAPVNMEASNMTMNSQAGVIELKGVPTGIVLGTNLEDKTMTEAVVVSDARFIQNFQYLEIPLYLRYSVVDARFDVELIGGISSNVLVGNETYLESSTGKSLVGKTQDMQDVNYSGTIGIGLKYGVSRRIFLNVEPRIKYYLHSLNTNSAVTYKPYTIGVYSGISYLF